MFRFSNDLDGYVAFEEWVKSVSEKSAKMDILIGCEPTGHYWFTFAKYVKERGMKLAFVNPYHVKQSKEMDDNSLRKTDQKDPKTIAKLVTEGRYSFPYIPEGIYAELREAVSVRDQIVKALNATSNRIQRWIRRFTSPKQIQKLAGLEPKENSSGKHKGRSSISKRGRRKLRRLLFQVVLPLIRSNEDFREVYTYYTTRRDNPLKGMQAMIAVSCKVIRIFYALLAHGMDYSSTRFRVDIIRPELVKTA